MSWQDWVLSAGQWVFIAALIPTVISHDKPALTTSLITGTVAVIFALTFATLSLWIAALSTLLTSATWFVLAYQKYRQNKK